MQTAGVTRPWEAVGDTEYLDAAQQTHILTAMESTRGRFMDEHRAPAARIAEIASESGRADLEMRARLILADIDARTSASQRSAADITRIIEWAEDAGDRYVQARGHFLQCIVQYSLGELASARIHGVPGVELLPEDTASIIRIDHLIMLAVTYGPGPSSEMHFRHALDLAAAIGDTDKTIAIHNNMAYFAWQTGNQAAALEHVAQMLALSTMRGIPLKASSLDTVAQIYITEGLYADAIEILGPVTDTGPESAPITGGGVLHTEPYALPACLLTVAKAQRLLGRLDRAEEAVDRAANLAAIRELPGTAADAMAERALLYAAEGRWREAYEQHVAYHEAAAALQSEEQEARARAIQARYDAGEQKQDSLRFRELAIRDALTGLYNRRFIDEQLATLTAQAAAERTPVSVAIVDADYFKRINDECSHEIGDKVLQALARILEESIVAPETVGRLGGEEFAILLPYGTSAEAAARCEQVRSAVAEHDWRPLVGDLPVTVSIGVTTAATGQTSPSALLSDADKNLYAAKRSGRNRVMGDGR